MTTEDLAQLLRDIRADTGQSAEQFTRALPVNGTRWLQWEGKHGLSRICHLLSVLELFGWEIRRVRHRGNGR